MSLKYQRASSTQEVEKVYNYTIDAFSDTPDFRWTLDEIKSELKDGWELYAVLNESGEIIEALFLKSKDNCLLSKNTGLKVNHQGSGYSHEIKDYVENIARKRKLKRVIHYCRIDNFRMYSLNESHGYVKKGPINQDPQVVEWVKNIEKK